MDSPVVVGHPYPIVEVCDQLPERLRCARHDALSKAVARAQIHKVRALAVAVDEFAAAEERPTVVIDHVLHFTLHSRVMHCANFIGNMPGAALGKSLVASMAWALAGRHACVFLSVLSRDVFCGSSRE